MPLWSSHASQPFPSTHARSGADHSAPGATTQLTSICANAPSSRNAGACSTTWRETVSPSRPLSRKRNADSGEITYGGLQVTSPKRRPSTGSKKLPSRSSTFSTPLSWALNAANSSARAFTSVATTRALCRAARIAWMPQPVPTSSAVPTGRRTVRCESVSDGPCTPAT